MRVGFLFILNNVFLIANLMKLIKLLRFLQAFLRLFISEITNRNQVHPRHYAIFEIFFKHFVYKQELDTNVKGRIFN